MAREVLAYFLSHPGTEDDLDAIARWRIKLQSADKTLDAVAAALRFLVELRYLTQVSTGNDARGQYRLNEENKAQAEQFLRGAAASGWLLGDVSRWLDALLLRYHVSNPADDGDHPGLARSPAFVSRVLAAAASASEPPSAAPDRPDTEGSWNVLLSRLERPELREPLARLYRQLNLTELELKVLLLCLAPELDAKYQKVFAFFNDDASRWTVTLGLACALLGEPAQVRDALARSGALSSWQLLERPGVLPYADEPLRLDGVLVAWLLGDEGALLRDARLSALLRPEPWPTAPWLAREAATEVVEALSAVANRAAGPQWVALVGPDPDGWRALLEGLATEWPCSLLRLAPPATTSAEAAQQDSSELLARAVRLSGALPVLDISRVDASEAAPLGHWSSALDRAGRGGVVISATAERALQVPLSGALRSWQRAAPSVAELTAAYESAAREHDLTLSADDSARLAATFPLPLADILRAVRVAQSLGPVLAGSGFELMAAACRNVAAPALPRFARCVEAVFGLEEVVLPEERRAQLREVVSHVLHATQVMNAWGFSAQLPYGRGVAALFFGPSGTGKTMAAQAIARELNTRLYVVDLSRVVSKYIGESEKNLDAVFQDAERAGAVLLFDEADALFGKRSEIKDAHDRYANIEVAYLLQRIESFTGLAILTTNFRQNLDQAFLRRLRFTVEFPKPDALGRQDIWRRCLPADAPLRSDVDLAALGRRLELTGGNIRQITLRAAFLAASEGASAIGMQHLLAATRAELRKLGMPSAERELADFDKSRSKRVA